MELNGKKLDEWFLDLKETEDQVTFPHNNYDYITKYKEISNQFLKWIHSEVGIGNKENDSAFLTNHGKDHIETLIHRTTQLVGNSPNCSLTPFEVFILLMAIHVHDVGNILGREDHEINARYIIERLDQGVVGQDTWIWDYIYQIAKAHKGKQIETLTEKDYLHDVAFRPQFLAAIIKFADELSENFARASSINLELDNIPEESKIYHIYAQAINSIIPQPQSREIKMIYNIKEEYLSEEYLKEGENTFLIDEIYLRTLKTYSERVYCMKFMRPLINIDSIKVTLNIKLQNGKRIQEGYELRERGIENICMDQLFRICPKLKGKTGCKFYEKINSN